MYEESYSQGMYRKDAVDTSVDAADSLYGQLTGLQRTVYNAIRDLGPNGCISDDVLASLPDYRYSTVTARYHELIDQLLIEDTGERRKGESGRLQRVMRATIWNLI